MRSLYEINKDYLEVIENSFKVDEETGEILFSVDDLETLETEFKDKVDNVACYIKDLEALNASIKEEKKVCHYLDIPIQHGTDEILKLMARRTNKQELKDIVSKLRDNIPDIVLRTTLITGFPGETEELHQELVEFVKEMKFERLGVFTYSKEEDTPAAKLKGQVTKKVKEASCMNTLPSVRLMHRSSRRHSAPPATAGILPVPSGH